MGEEPEFPEALFEKSDGSFVGEPEPAGDALPDSAYVEDPEPPPRFTPSMGAFFAGLVEWWKSWSVKAQRWSIGITVLVVLALVANITEADSTNESNASVRSDSASFDYIDFADCHSDLLDAEACAKHYDPADSYSTFAKCSDDTFEDDFCAVYFEEATTLATLPPTLPPTTAAVFIPPPPRLAPVASGCDPNYTGCVPIASDVDCAGGSGNGPAYTGFTEVIGVDIYGLDADNDGLGCE